MSKKNKTKKTIITQKGFKQCLKMEVQFHVAPRLPGGERGVLGSKFMRIFPAKFCNMCV